MDNVQENEEEQGEIKKKHTFLRQLTKSIAEKERTHKQWDKWVICMFILASVILVNLLRGGKGADSVIGIDSCSVVDWVIQVFYLGICALVTYYGVQKVKYEQ